MEQSRWAKISPSSQLLRSTFANILAQLGVAETYPAAVLAQANEAAARVPGPEYVDRRDIALVTIDPASSLDLDQAVHIERLPEVPGEGATASRWFHDKLKSAPQSGIDRRLRSGDSHVSIRSVSDRPPQGTHATYRVYYAIADLGFFVDPGSPLDDEVNQRGLTVYGPDRRIGLHPPVLSEDAASLLPNQDRPAALWTIELDAQGNIVDANVERALVRSRAKLSYEQVQAALDNGTADESLCLLKVVGQLRQKIERLRGGVSLEVPEQEVEEDVDGDFNLLFRRTLPVEEWNAQISLLTGIAAAQMMLAEGVGILRTLPPADPHDLRKLRATAKALGIDWPKKLSYSELLRRLDSSNPRHAAFMTRATMLFRGAGYLAFDHPTAAAAGSDHLNIAASGGAEINVNKRHAAIAAEYAHVTAPLRRLVDRYGTEICLAYCAGRPVPAWVLAKLPLLPAEMAAAYRTANKFERDCANVIEASLLAGRVGEVFDGVVVDLTERKDKPNTRGEVMLADPAVLARIDGENLELGEHVKAKLIEANIPDGVVRFEAA